MSSADAAVDRRIEDLIAALEPLEDTRLAPAKELVQAVLELHTQGLAALMTLLSRAGAAGQPVVEACLQNRETRALLLLHGLHPHPVGERVRQALAGLRAELGVQGVRVQLIGLDEGAGVPVLTLRLEVTTQRNFSAPALRAQIEAAVLELAPEIGSIIIEGLPAAGEVAFVPLASLRTGLTRNDAKEIS